ncbi:periplasmic protein TonB [Mariprofundus micogutta]|uniref:Protein TonB n=1 Tax=Mariprofundus micogutta TaxID=1921010 RepID=A0A1L8CJT0_9PROT|nr:energy transducer TonB [Mariprofundus micogutta]GAV19145.1 periplasmic protein TonB [Mariprofundus micogutta]
MSTLILAPSVSLSGHGIRYGAITLSLLLHGLLFASYGGTPATATQQPIESVTRLSFLAPAPQPVAAPDIVPEIKPEKAKPKPKPKRKPEKKTVRKKVVKPVHESVEEQISEPVAVAAQEPAAASAAVPQIDEGLIKRETERYLTEVMAHIEQHKWYPKAARRRGIEGEVNVSFTLLPDGSAYKLVVENGPSLLVAAARQAVEKATPMPQPPAGIHCPLECQFRMRFNLKAS